METLPGHLNPMRFRRRVDILLAPGLAVINIP